LRPYDLARLLGLAALWSLQFVFLRLAVPEFGAGLTAEGRALFGALVLIPAAIWLGQRIAPLEHWKDYLKLSLINNVVPFACMAYAASALPAGYLAIINGLVSPFAAVCAAWMLGERLGPSRTAGLLVGILGVALTVNLGPVALDLRTLLATGSALLGMAAWAYASVMIKQRSGRMPPVAMAAGTMAFSALLMGPLWTTAPPAAAWLSEAGAALVALGAVGSGCAYLAFFTLIRDIGPSRTLTVGFLIPVLGVMWGWLLLDEPVTLSMVLGGALVLAAMALVLRR
jgi:drug/metabolite transporter (DMT)-like permease